jgi:hypothetical protein
MRVFIVILTLLWSFSACAGVSVWIPFDSGRGHISIPVTLNGEESRAILDSGATGNGVSERFLERHEGEYSNGKQVLLEGINGVRKVRLVNGLDIEMFGTSFKIDHLMPLRQYSGDLVIGLRFFESFVLQIDYPNSRLRILTHDVLDLKEHANVKMKKSGGSAQPMVEVDLNDEHKLWLMLDTGNNTGIFMPRSVAVRHNWMEEFGAADSLVSGVTKVSSVQRFNIPTMTIGPFTLENVIVMVPGEGEKTTVGKGSSAKPGSRLKKDKSDGILGYDVLKHFVVTIDFKRSLLHLAPPEE